jgi:hypothetical protein
MHKIKLTSMIIFFVLCWSTLSAAEGDSIKDTMDKILSAQGGEVLDLIDDTDKLHLQRDDLIQLYIQLLDYYVGEGPGEIRAEKITKMGDEILPFLVEKKRAPLRCSEKYRRLCYKDMKERNVIIEKMIKAIKDGTVLYAEFPDNLKPEAEKDLKIIRIFIDDFKGQRGSLPKDLNVLKDYAWERYGYKLRILNPWGERIKYLRKTDTTYSLEAGKEGPF